MNNYAKFGYLSKDITVRSIWTTRSSHYLGGRFKVTTKKKRVCWEKQTMETFELIHTEESSLA